jgi:hypothetical protein
MPDYFTDLTGAIRAATPMLIPGIAVKTRHVTLQNGEVYAPDLRQGMHHHIHIAGAAVTVNNPILGGFEFAGWSNLLLTHVLNESGGAITITWGSAYRQPAFTDPADGDGVVTLWNFDTGNGLWTSSGRNVVANA